MSSNQAPAQQRQASQAFGFFGAAMEYAIDAAQRTVLFWDVMRQRGNQYREHMAEAVPNVLSYEAELIVDGRTLERPDLCASCRRTASPSIRAAARLSSSIRVQATAQGLAGSKPIAKWGSSSRRVIPVTSLDFCPSPGRDRPSRILPARRQSFLRR